MTTAAPEAEHGALVWQRALQSAALYAANPLGLGGIWLRASAGPVRDRWLETLTTLLLATATPLRRIPVHTTGERLLGGLDLSATLAAGRPVMAKGLLTELDGQVALLPSAERCPPYMTHLLCQALDHGRLRLERDGMAADLSARLGLIALDEGIDDDETIPESLAERLAFVIDLRGLRAADCDPGLHASGIVEAASLIASVTVDDTALKTLVNTASALGIPSLRTALFAVRAACASAAIAGRTSCDDEDLALAAQLVLAPRATQFPADESPSDSEEAPAEPQHNEPQDPPETPPESTERDELPPDNEQDADEQPMPDPQDILLAAIAAALPPGLLQALQGRQTGKKKAGASGRNRSKQRSPSRGRAVGVIAGFPPGSRLALVDTLRAAAPMQALRRRERQHSDPSADAGARLQVRRSDFRAQRRVQSPRTTTIFAVDSSGSSALQRLAEAKGAVESLLAECYVRRDQVALLTFRGEQADLCLPPTRSLPRAKRALADLPGGGGTPIAAGLIAARELAERVRRDGDQALLVIFSDGRANVALDPSASRAVAQADALAAARQIAAQRFQVLFIDTAPRPQPQARELAEALSARYLPLPRLSAGRLNDAIRQLAG